jgi:hypothetical protein
VGDCHVRVDSNVDVAGGDENAQADTNGVYCAKDTATGISSRCTVLANTTVRGSIGGFPPRSVGIRCDDQACARIEGNTLITGRQGVYSTGIVLNNAGPVIAKNIITAGCGTTLGVGLQSINSFARVENNVIHGSANTVACNPTNAGSYAVVVQNGSSSNEIDLHSNTVLADGLANACTSKGLVFDIVDGGVPGGGLGLVRNNILGNGTCMNRASVHELNVSADPRVFQNNYFYNQTTMGSAAQSVFYRDENMTNLLDAGAVNALTDMTVSGNIEGNAALGAGPLYHLGATSVCRNAGIDAGFPLTDIDGDSRPQEGVPDIGADEYVP